MSFPTFQEWHIKKYGRTFNELHRGEIINRAADSFTEELQYYCSEMIDATIKEKLNVPPIS
jgi:hypothetical protein